MVSEKEANREIDDNLIQLLKSKAFYNWLKDEVPRHEVEEDIRRRRLEPLDPKVVVKYVNDLKKFLESSNIFERRAFLGTFIDSMEVDDGEITFNYGLTTDGAEQETVSVLGIIPLAPPSWTKGKTRTFEKVFPLIF